MCACVRSFYSLYCTVTPVCLANTTHTFLISITFQNVCKWQSKNLMHFIAQLCVIFNCYLMENVKNATAKSLQWFAIIIIGIIVTKSTIRLQWKTPFYLRLLKIDRWTTSCPQFQSHCHPLDGGNISIYICIPILKLRKKQIESLIWNTLSNARSGVRLKKSELIPNNTCSQVLSWKEVGWIVLFRKSVPE